MEAETIGVFLGAFFGSFAAAFFAARSAGKSAAVKAAERVAQIVVQGTAAQTTVTKNLQVSEGIAQDVALLKEREIERHGPIKPDDRSPERKD